VTSESTAVAPVAALAVAAAIFTVIAVDRRAQHATLRA